MDLQELIEMMTGGGRRNRNLGPALTDPAGGSMTPNVAEEVPLSDQPPPPAAARPRNRRQWTFDDWSAATGPGLENFKRRHGIDQRAFERWQSRLSTSPPVNDVPMHAANGGGDMRSMTAPMSMYRPGGSDGPPPSGGIYAGHEMAGGGHYAIDDGSMSGAPGEASGSAPKIRGGVMDKPDPKPESEGKPVLRHGKPWVLPEQGFPPADPPRGGGMKRKVALKKRKPTGGNQG